MHRPERDVRLLAVGASAPNLRQPLLLPLRLTLEHTNVGRRDDEYEPASNGVSHYPDPPRRHWRLGVREGRSVAAVDGRDGRSRKPRHRWRGKSRGGRAGRRRPPGDRWRRPATQGGGGGAVLVGTGGVGGTGGAPPPPLMDFPTDPIFVDPAIPRNAPSLFDASGPAGSAPCITSPEAETLMPRNWLRPRFDYRPTRDENLFEVTVSVSGFAHSLRAYTRDRSYTFDKELWARLRTSVNDAPIGVSVRALGLSASGTVETPASAAAHTSFVIAPVDAPGKIVYWALANGLGSLKGFG